MSGSRATPMVETGVLRADLDNEVALVRRLGSGDEAAFEELVSRYHVAMVRLARSFVSTEAAAEDVAQEAWLGVMRGIERFEGRSTVKTWLFRILVNRAKSRGVQESRCVPLSSLATNDDHRIEPDRFVDHSDRCGGYLATAAGSWRYAPELRAINSETRKQLKIALDSLPPAQQAVVRMRDVLGLTAAEVCKALKLSEANQRVLLHRGRSRMRAILESPDMAETTQAS